MVMETIQIRLSKGLIKNIDHLVEEEIYANRSDAIREAVRKQFFWEKEVCTISYKGSGVQRVREVREKLSKQNINLKEINNL